MCQRHPPFACAKHVGLYVYDAKILREFVDLPPSLWELSESLEQLRALAAGIPIGMVEADFEAVSIDTAEDLERVQKYY